MKSGRRCNGNGHILIFFEPGRKSLTDLFFRINEADIGIETDL